MRETWSCERLLHTRAVALGNALDSSTKLTYTSHLQSYLTFCKQHGFAIEPTPDTLSFYVVYMAHHISTKSLQSYLSGIISSIEHLFPEAWTARNAALIKRTLQGCMRIHPRETHRKRALMYSDLDFLLARLTNTSSWDDILFTTIVLTGFYGVMRLGELVYPDAVTSRNILKVIKRRTLELKPDRYQFHLPAHKADRFFEGSLVLIQASDTTLNPLPVFLRYIKLRDERFLHHTPLFLRHDSSIPHRSWFIKRIKDIFPDNIRKTT
jgi:hypothetical protein